jgi:hypothetical protein
LIIIDGKNLTKITEDDNIAAEEMQEILELTPYSDKGIPC